MTEKLLLLLLIVFSATAIYTPKLDRAVIYLGMFSFLCSLLYLFYHSPNVAIAEAVIGCTLATVVYLVALRKQKRFTVYIVNGVPSKIVNEIDLFCAKEDISFHYVHFSKKQYQAILEKKDWEMLINQNENTLTFVSKRYNYKLEALADYLSTHPDLQIKIQLVEMSDAYELEDL